MPAGRPRSIDEVYAWDQTASQGLLVDVEHATLGRLTLPGPPLRFFDGDDQERPRRCHSAPPTLDQHGPALFAELGLDLPVHPQRGGPMTAAMSTGAGRGLGGHGARRRVVPHLGLGAGRRVDRPRYLADWLPRGPAAARTSP